MHQNMSRLVRGRTHYNGVTYVCNECLYPFSFKDVLDRHTPECMRNPPQAVKYPDPDDCTLKFQANEKQFRLPFYLVCDFGSFLSPADDGDDHHRATRLINEHRVCGIAVLRATA